MFVYLFWLLMIIAWNYGVPNAEPIEDVAMAIIIGFIAHRLNKFFKDNTILKKNKYFGNKK